MAKRHSILIMIIIPLLTVMIVGITVQTILVSKMSSKNVMSMSLETADNSTQRYIHQLSEMGVESYTIATLLAPMLEVLAGFENGREIAVDLMKQELSGSTNIVSIWACYEPDAFDGMDSSHAGTADFENETGRFVPYVYKTSSNGDVTVRPLADYNDPQRSDYYQGAKSSEKPYLAGPFLYTINGQEKLFCTVAIPILRDGEFVGAVGTDISLDTISSTLSKAMLMNQGYFFAITDSGEFIVPPEENMLLKHYSDTWMSSFSDYFEELSDEENYTQVTSKGSDDQDVILTAGTVHFANSESAWIVGSVMPLNDVHAPASEMTTWILLTGLAICIIVSILMIIIIRNNLGELPKLKEIAEKLSVGNMNVRIKNALPGETSNEIESLKQSFEKLIRSTHEQVSDVQRVAGGDYSFEINPHSDNDILNIALGTMVENLNEMHRNLTNAKQFAEREKRRVEAANASKDIFLAQMSTDMHTPLNAIIGLSELLLASDNPSGESLDEEARADIQNIYTSGVALLGLINDILDLSRANSGHFKLIGTEYDLPSIINDTMTMNAVHIGNRPIDFRLQVDSSLPSRLYGDELRIKQVWSSILDNAFKYTNEGYVEFRISWKKSEEEGYIWLNTDIEDTGIGIRSEDMANLFTNTEQVAINEKTKYSGVGISLPLAYKLSQLMGGSITASSIYGRGSSFTVSVKQRLVTDIPLGEDVVSSLMSFEYADSKRRTNEKISRMDLSHARVLVVDDVKTNITIARGMLKPYGIKVDSANSGMEAVDKIREGEPKYDAIFMDHMMPEMDGVETVNAIRNDISTDYAKDIPIIALTANAVPGKEDWFLKRGFQYFIAKPINITDLDDALRLWIPDKTGNLNSGLIESKITDTLDAGENNEPDKTDSVPVPEKTSEDNQTTENVNKPIRNVPSTYILSELLKACMLFDTDKVNRLITQLESYSYKDGEELIHWLRDQASIMAFRPIAARLTKELEDFNK